MSHLRQHESLTERGLIHPVFALKVRRPDLTSVLGAPKRSGRPCDCAHLVERRQGHSLDTAYRDNRRADAPEGRWRSQNSFQPSRCNCSHNLERTGRGRKRPIALKLYQTVVCERARPDIANKIFLSPTGMQNVIAVYPALFGRCASASFWLVIPVSWGITFFEYCLAVPANRIGILYAGGLCCVFHFLSRCRANGIAWSHSRGGRVFRLFTNGEV